MKKKRTGKTTKKKKSSNFLVMRGCLTMLAEICGIIGFLIALFIFIKEYL